MWAVLGESGGGCGGGCGGGGCGSGCGSSCGGGGGGCGGGGGGVIFGTRRNLPPPNLSLVGAGAGCGAGSHIASCGAGTRDPTDIRPPQNMRAVPPKVVEDLSDSAISVILCDIDIIKRCLNKHALENVSVVSYVQRPSYHDTYQ